MYRCGGLCSGDGGGGDSGADVTEVIGKCMVVVAAVVFNVILVFIYCRRSVE